MTGKARKLPWRKRIASFLSVALVVNLLPSVLAWGDTSDKAGSTGEELGACSATFAEELTLGQTVSLGDFHSAAIKEDGSLWMWGTNRFGSLGDSTVSERHYPVEVLDGVSSVTLGYNHSASIRNDSSLWTWGHNDVGQLGNGTAEYKSSPPTMVMKNVILAALGDSFSAAIKKDGSLWMWGANECGQLGDGTTKDRYNPVKIMDGVAFVSLGDSHSAAIKKDGSLWTWGNNYYGQLGDGTTKDRHSPIKIMDGVSSVALGDWHSAAIKQDDSLWTWGANYNGELGDNTTELKYTPEKIMDDALAISLGGSHSAAVKKDGSLWTWGYNPLGELGDGTTKHKYYPIKIMDNVSSVSLGYSHSSAVKKDGSLWMWGDNYYGQLGDGTTEGRYSPVKIMEGVALPGSVGPGMHPNTPNFSTSVVSLNSLSIQFGEDAHGSITGPAFTLFPGNYMLKSALIPIELSKETQSDGTYVIRGQIGIGRSNLLDDHTSWSKYKKCVKQVMLGEIKYGFLKKYYQGKPITAFQPEAFKKSPEVGIAGYLEQTYSASGELLSSESGVAADAEWEGKLAWQFATPIGPLYVDLKGGGKISGDFGVAYSYSDKAASFEGMVKITPKISVEGGYGISGIATIGAQGSASIPVQVVPASKGSFSAKAAIHAYLVFVIDFSWDLAQFEADLWDTTSRGVGGARMLSNGMPPKGSYRLADRTYTQDTSTWQGGANSKSMLRTGAVAETSSEAVVLQQGVMPQMLPQVMSVDGKQVMVFHQDDLSRAVADSSKLVYSVREGDTWTEPKPVWDTGTLDAFADMQMIGNELYLTWQKEKAPLEGDPAVDADAFMADMAAKSEVCVARFDSASNYFTDAHYITSNDVLDMMPTIAVGGDKLALQPNLKFLMQVSLIKLHLVSQAVRCRA